LHVYEKQKAQLSIVKADRTPLSEGQQMWIRNQFSTPVWIKGKGQQ